MSQFSDRLKMILDESGTNIYQISKNAKLDRTTIQRALKGERLPGISFVEKLCDYLKVSPLQRSELQELYTISKVGEKVYTGRKYIKYMIERMAAVHIKSDNIPIGRRTITIGDHIEAGIKTFSGQYNVQNLIRDVLEDEVFNEAAPHIYLTVPFENTFLFDLLYRLFLSCSSTSSTQDDSKKILVKHVIQLSKNPLSLQDSNYNLNILSNVLPFAFCEWGAYEPYYCYGNVEASRDIYSVLPYYILTSKYVIQLSADFNMAVLSNSNEIYNIYSDSFEKCLLKTWPLVKQLKSCGELLTAYLTAFREAGHFTHVVEPQPCFSKYYTEELIENKLRRDVENREQLKDLVCELYGNWKRTNKIPISIFSVEGIEYFAKTGTLADLPYEYALPFTIEERKMLLEQLRYDISADIYFVRAANSSGFAISPLASLVVHGTDILMLCTINSSGVMSTSLIREKSICEAFYDFLDSLPESNLLCSKEETIRIIDRVIDGLDGKLA